MFVVYRQDAGGPLEEVSRWEDISTFTAWSFLKQAARVGADRRPDVAKSVQITYPDPYDTVRRDYGVLLVDRWGAVLAEYTGVWVDEDPPKLTYRQLVDKVKTFAEADLDRAIRVKVRGSDEFLEVSSLETGDDVFLQGD